MKEAFAVIGISLTIIGYVPYFRDIFAGKTKPHAFTWLIWSTLTAIAFFAQLSDGGGAGSAVLGLTALVSFMIFIPPSENPVLSSTGMNDTGNVEQVLAPA